MATMRELSDGVAAAIAAAAGSVVTIQARRRPSTGIGWSDKHVVTAAHGVQREEGLMVVLPDGQERAATLLGRDSSTDVALLEVAGGGLTPAKWVQGDPPAVGALVFPLGRVHGLRATFGMVAERGGAWQTATGGLVDAWIDVDGTLPPGFSGGPLIDADGLVVGMNTSGLTPHGAVLPWATVSRVATRIEQHGTAAPGYLGAGFYPGSLPDDVAAIAGQRDALMTVSLEPDGPARKAGLLVGDALVRVDTVAVTGLRHLLGILAAKGSGTTVKLTVVRASQLVDLDVQLGARPHRPRC
jgi:S1-C subfamily serine protease